jgi:hypothetical protein
MIYTFTFIQSNKILWLIIFNDVSLQKVQTHSTDIYNNRVGNLANDASFDLPLDIKPTSLSNFLLKYDLIIMIIFLIKFQKSSFITLIKIIIIFN